MSIATYLYGGFLNLSERSAGIITSFFGMQNIRSVYIFLSVVTVNTRALGFLALLQLLYSFKCWRGEL